MALIICYSIGFWAFRQLSVHLLLFYSVKHLNDSRGAASVLLKVPVRMKGVQFVTQRRLKAYQMQNTF